MVSWRLAMTRISSLLVLALGISLCTGIILDDIVDLERLNLKFDFIIVGGIEHLF
jgi:hypothetical protein